MKKLSILFASLLAVVAFSSCEEDTTPQYKNPTTFVLNTPALANQFMDLDPEGTIYFTCSQPDYGYSAVTQYSMETSLDPNFETSEPLETVDRTLAKMQIRQSDLALAICKLLGVESAEDFDADAVRTIYFRAKAQLEGIESSQITSNVVSLNKVRSYYAIQEPGFIYLVGAPEGWAGPTESAAAHYADWRLFESKNAIGSKIYSAVFDIPAGKAMFRFYTALTGWDADSYGTQVDDNPIDVAMVDGVYSGPMVKGKGSYNIPDWEGGSMKITVNMSNEKAMMVTFEAGGVDTNDKEFIYLVGAPEGWAGPDEANASHYVAWKLYDLEGNKVYTATFNIPADAATFRFYTALTGWDGGASIGSQVDDASVDFDFSNGNIAANLVVPGKGNYNLTNWNGGKVKITVDLGAKKVKFEMA